MTTILDQIWPVYEAETRDQLQSLATGLVELEGVTLPEVVTRLRRVAHSLKGSAAAIGLLDVEEVAHAIEDVLALAEGGRPLPAAAVEAALGAVSAIGDALSAAPRGRIVPRQEVLAGLAAARDGAARGPGGPQGAAAPTPEPRLEHLAKAVAALCTADAAARAGRAAAARQEAEALAATLAGRPAELARSVAGAAALLEAPDADVARAVARAGAELVALRGELARSPAAAAPAAPSPGAAGPAETPRAPAAGRDERLVRVDAGRLDAVANDVDQLIVGVARRERRSREAQALDKALRESLRLLERGAAECGLHGEAGGHPLAQALQRLRSHGLELGRHAREARRDSEQERLLAQGLRGRIQTLRMAPASAGLAWVRPAMRELAAQLGKDVAVSLTGGDLRLDRRVLEELKAPLLHLLRNALDHGVEPPSARVQAGKPSRASIDLSVQQRGDRVLVTVRDDGAGLSPARLRDAAVRRGLLGLEEAGRLSDQEAARLAFRPGLSTASEITAVSGRGVGLDVVAEAVRRLGGDVDVTFEPGKGTAFVLEVPLTISGGSGLLVRGGGGLALLPAEAVERVLLVDGGQIVTFAGEEHVEVDGAPVPYTTLEHALGGAAATATRAAGVALLIASGGRRLAVAIDEVLGSHTILVSPLGPRLAGARHLAGAAVLDDGRVVGVLHAAQLVGQRRRAVSGEGPRKARVVVADDSLSTRMTVKHLLEVAGFQVLPAADGEEALALAREGGCDLVVSDVQMPRLDGLGLTRRLKGDPALARIPVILVTSLGRPEDHAAGLEAGADGYVVKGDVQTGRLVELVRRLLPA